MPIQGHVQGDVGGDVVAKRVKKRRKVRDLSLSPLIRWQKAVCAECGHEMVTMEQRDVHLERHSGVLDFYDVWKN